jgi:hypothetical protein
VKTTFFKRYPAENRTEQSGLFLDCLHSELIFYVELNKKIAGLGGVKGGSHECILHNVLRVFVLLESSFSEGIELFISRTVRKSVKCYV